MSCEEGEEKLSKIFASRLCFDNESEPNNALENGEIPSFLKSLECPFTWKYDFLPDNILETTARIEEKLQEVRGGDAELLPWKCFLLNLILCCEYAKIGCLDDAIEKQSICDQILDDEIAIQKTSAVYMGIGLRHISLACKCYLLYASHMPVDVEKICDNIVPFDELPPRDQASVLGTKGAYCAEFGYRGMKESVTFIEKAIEIYDSPEWYYLLGRSLGRLRRLEKRNAIPEKRELQALEVAVEKINNLSYMVLLAQTYRETSRCVFNQYLGKYKSFKTDTDGLKSYCDTMNKMSKEMYMKVLIKGKNDIHALVRCALGLMKLPRPWQQLDVAKDCILTALNLAPDNPMANHVAGLYFNYEKDTKQAISYFARAAVHKVYGAEIDLIVAKKKNDKSYDPLADMERLLHVYKEKPRQENIMCHIGTYYYVKNDIKTAFKYWFQVLEADIHSEALKDHFETISYNKKVVNINKVIIKEILKLLDKGNLSESEIQFFNQIINRYILNHPNIVSECTNIDLSKFSNQKFEYSSWKNEQLGCNFFSTSSRNRNEVDKKSIKKIGNRNPGSVRDGKGRKMATVSSGDNQTRKDVASSLSQSIAEVPTFTASIKETKFEENSNVKKLLAHEDEALPIEIPASAIDDVENVNEKNLDRNADGDLDTSNTNLDKSVNSSCEEEQSSAVGPSGAKNEEAKSLKCDELEQLEIKNHVEQRKGEKLEEKLVGQLVKKQIEDKVTQQTKFGLTTSPESFNSLPSPQASKNYLHAKLQIRLTNGQALIATFGAKEQLSAVRFYVQMHRTDGDCSFHLMTNFPKRIFSEEDYEKTLDELGLVPTAVVIVSKGNVVNYHD